MPGVYVSGGDVSARNLQNQNLTPGLVVIYDTASEATDGGRCAKLPTAAAQEPAGVVQSTTLTDSSGTVRTGQSVTIRRLGTTDCVAAAAITAGQLVAIADTAGRVGPATQTAGGTAPAGWVVGTANSSVTAANQLVEVDLGFALY